MTYRDLKNQIKEQQKSLAQQIRSGKTGRKPSRRSDENYTDWDCLETNQWAYRHTHIAYCEFFNKTPYELIENYCHESPNRWRIDDIKKEWEGQIDEALRNCA